MPAHSADEQFLHRALELARAGVGLASPNPYVGAVISDQQGNIVGTGTYTYAGAKHAEILALEAAGANARGGTLYINLEPHAHHGRTPPCTDALISAGIQRVVASMADPNPKVSGRGFEQLRAAGVKVEVGRLEDEARRLNEAFARYIRHGTPLVTLKSAMTLDGKIAPPPADASNHNSSTPNAGQFSGTWITGEAARTHAHQLRHQHDAILVGVGTVLADNPLLTDRSGRPRRRPLLRVILDSRLRLGLKSQVVRSAQHDVLVFTCASASSARAKALMRSGVEICRVRPRRGRPDLQAVLEELGRRDILSVMLEAGPLLNRAVLEADLVEKVRLFYAPTLVGLGSSLPGLRSHKHAGALRVHELSDLRTENFGPDFAVEGYLRDVYRNH
jgi:diaminohydroxyphosphoribosylaminopyrimidine deaminase/5-amino-6-(5-phosphoribosylamino)uracil reductase